VLDYLAENKIHGLLIGNEPDAWMINLESMTGRHIVDSGPTFNCRLPIFSPLGKNDGPDLLTNDLQFGRELEFLEKLGASPQAGPVIHDYEKQPFDAKLFDRPERINIEEIKPPSKSTNPCAADQTSGKNLLLGLLRFLCVVYSPRFTISPHLGGLS
jgi:hypothetical protein